MVPVQPCAGLRGGRADTHTHISRGGEIIRKFTVGIAVVVALVVAGGAGAASQFVITSTHQIKPSVLAKLRGHRGPRGRRGLAGPAGTAGQTGAPGASGLVSMVPAVGPVTTAPPLTNTSVTVEATVACPTGTTAVSGGWAPDQTHPPLLATIVASVPDNQINGWAVELFNDDTNDPAAFEAVVNCAVRPAASAAAQSGSAAAQVQGALAAAKAATHRGLTVP
jgi:hypothetical protein